jgi:hypothetical protein
MPVQREGFILLFCYLRALRVKLEGSTRCH